MCCSHDWGVQRHIFLAPVPGERSKGQILLNIIKISITKLISKIFKPNFVCLLTNERYKTYQTGFSLGPLGHSQGFGTGSCPRGGTLGYCGGLGVNFFFQNSTRVGV